MRNLTFIYPPSSRIPRRSVDDRCSPFSRTAAFFDTHLIVRTAMQSHSLTFPIQSSIAIGSRPCLRPGPCRSYQNHLRCILDLLRAGVCHRHYAARLVLKFRLSISIADRDWFSYPRFSWFRCHLNYSKAREFALQPKCCSPTSDLCNSELR